MSSLINNLKTIASYRAKKELDSGVVEENNKIRANYKKNLIPLNDMTSNKNNYKIIKRSFFKDYF